MTKASLGSKPFYVHIATLFILLFSVLGGALIMLQFQQGMQQGLEHERQNFQQYREQLSLAIKLNQRPARMSLSLLRSGQLADATRAIQQTLGAAVARHSNEPTPASAGATPLQAPSPAGDEAPRWRSAAAAKDISAPIGARVTAATEKLKGFSL